MSECTSLTDKQVLNERVVFCTSYIDSDVERYQNWINYYTEFFKDCGVDLWMINDGPVHKPLDFKGVNLQTFDDRIGRKTTWIFPGWKRSFYHAINWFSFRYKRIAHVESDCWLTEKAKSAFIYYLNEEGYFTGYTPTYNFPETALQIINNRSVRQYIIDKYSCVENWYENIDFEQDIKRLEPSYILDGDRIEGKHIRFSKRFTFIANATYQEFKRLYDG